MANQSKNGKYKLIYNPHAGKKRQMFGHSGQMTLEDIKLTLQQYQIDVDYYPTEAAGHATTLATEAIKEGYNFVLAAGGDGTVGEVANGLINSEVTLGIIPLGSFMNIALMLEVPKDIETAIALIKIGRTRKIDVGCMTGLTLTKELSGVTEKSRAELTETTPYYFFESVGIGLEAQLHENLLEWERGNWTALLKIWGTLTDYYGHKATIMLDDKEIVSGATLINVSNGPYSGANLPMAPQAKLNDHRLTVRLYKMSKLELSEYFIAALIGSHNWLIKRMKLNRRLSPKIETHLASTVKITTKTKRLVHADARLFGETPVELKIIPNALNVIVGFPKPGSPTALLKRTYLDP